MPRLRLTRGPLGAFTLGIATLIALFAAPAMASANVYCVDVAGGDCTHTAATPQAALNLADANAGADRVRLGVGTYVAPNSGGFQYSGADAPVELVGSGVGQTTLTVAGGDPVNQVLNVTGQPGTLVSDLRILIPAPVGIEQYYGIQTGGLSALAVERVRIEAPDVFNGFGMLLAGGGTVADTEIELPNDGASPNNVGLQNYDSVTVTDSSIVADSGVSSSVAGTVATVRRSTLEVSFTGVDVQQGDAVIANSVIATAATGVSVGNPNGHGAAEDSSASVNGATIVGTGAGQTTGVDVFTNSNQLLPDAVSATVANTILDQSLDTAIRRSDDAEGSADVTIGYSNFDPASNFETNDIDGDPNPPPGGTGIGTGAITTLAGNVDVASGFVDAAGGDYHLTLLSPLVDAGSPGPAAPGELDIDGGARVVNNKVGCFDPNDVARRDIGADEVNAMAIPGCPALQARVSGKRKVFAKKRRARVRFTFSVTPSVAGTSAECSLDGDPFAPCTSPFAARLKLGKHTLRVRAVFNGFRGQPASHTVKVKKKRKKK